MEAILVLARRLAGKNRPTTHAMSDRARGHVAQFIADLECKEARISSNVGDKALDAAYTYGGIVNHAAGLNMGDCFAYARASLSIENCQQGQ
ncbi:hypothetical protein [Brucella intermedia]|uniref:hypothetical protein n=1 Tax=Brucella intermedia TaxID=94625 RepID=UPI00200030AC|nr:hypothetical protein [Brucella intermedia]